MSQHLEVCEECAELWREMQQAQELVLRLPRHPVSPGFHTRLWERIKAGEGTPAAVFNEPMPLVTKARYVLTGAVAAALMLLFVNGWASGSADKSGDVGVGMSTDLGAMNPMPLVPPTLAQQAARVVANDYKALNRSFHLLQNQPGDQLDEATLRNIRANVGAVKSLGEVLLWMKSRQHVELPPEMEVTLRLAIASLDPHKLNSMRNRSEVQATLSPVIREIQSLERLPREMMVRMDYRPEEQLDLAEFLVQRREPLNYLRIQVFSGRPGSLRLQVFDQDQIHLFLMPPEK